MRAFLWRWLAVSFIAPSWAYGHVGSPDVFYDGFVGPYPARITIRMPGVVPGRAEISVRVQTDEPVKVSFLPLYARTPLTNAPPPDPGLLVAGETNLYSGELWLMSFGAYSIDIRISGKTGEGAVQIPVNSVAIRQLPLPRFLGKLLLLLGALLFLGGIGIVAAAARDSALIPGASATQRDRRKGLTAAGATFAILVLLLIGGKKWWALEETDFRRHLREGAWPDLWADVRMEGSQRILTLTLGKKAFPADHLLSLVPDHGKLLHFFLIQEPNGGAFAHLHPVRKGGKTFEVALPPLPEGDYRIFCDLTFEESGLSSTATNSVHLPALPAANAVTEGSVRPDEDDSWSLYSTQSVPTAAAGQASFQFPDGRRVIWHSAWPIHAKSDASLKFEVRDAVGQPVALEPYMGMLSHAAILRSDGTVFAHLHPSGNYSMAAQGLFESRFQREMGSGLPAVEPMAMDHAQMRHEMPAAISNRGIVSLPYEFPAAGEYRLWVQFKTQGQVLTAVFDAKVLPP